MAVASSSVTTRAARTNTTVTAPSGIVDDDLLILIHVLGMGSPVPATAPAGFTALPGTWPQVITDSGASYAMHLRMWAKVADGESGDYTITHAETSGAFGACIGAMLRVSDVDTDDPFRPVPTVNIKLPGGADEANSTFLSLTTEEDDSTVIAVGFDWGDTATGLTPPTGSTPTFTEHIDAATLYVASGVLATAGATGNKTMANNSSGSSPWGALLLAVAPAGEGGDPDPDPEPGEADTFVRVAGEWVDVDQKVRVSGEWV